MGRSHHFGNMTKSELVKAQLFVDTVLHGLFFFFFLMAFILDLLGNLLCGWGGY